MARLKIERRRSNGRKHGRNGSRSNGTGTHKTNRLGPKAATAELKKLQFQDDVKIYQRVNIPALSLEDYDINPKKDEGSSDLVHSAVKYAWIGVGQCGGRLAQSFYALGYRKVIALNTTRHDLDSLDLPKANKFLMEIGGRGAGKDASRGREAVQENRQEIFHLMEKTFGSQFDHIMLMLGAGGGTGSGSAVELVETAKKYARAARLSNPKKRVGVMLTLPTVGEANSPIVAENAFRAVSELSAMADAGELSPLIIVDNDKISRMYPGLTVRGFWPTVNNTVSGLFNIFNRLSALSSGYTSFDAVDYHSIMSAGGCTIMGLTKVKQFKDRYAISEAVKANLEKTLLADGFDLSTAKVAGCIVVGGRKLMAKVEGLQDNIDHAFDVLSNITGKAAIHRGIYEDDRDSLRVYTIIGGLKPPVRRIAELEADIPQNEQ